MQAHEKKTLMDDAFTTLDNACDTDSVYWETLAVGQDSSEAEASGYLMGYRDALSAMQALWTHDQREPLAEWVKQVGVDMREQQATVEEQLPDETFFWNG